MTLNETLNNQDSQNQNNNINQEKVKLNNEKAADLKENYQKTNNDNNNKNNKNMNTINQQNYIHEYKIFYKLLCYFIIKIFNL